ncbi:hypothetical protein AN958_12084 [Leucoagaricus sp. SymC.cos]|nr:hypothetical protein AN958_12084 [Leucoagaricus sp. SymC.cos]
MADIKSSQEFIRALKASSDPPVTGGPSKIEIARQAWVTNAFYLPSKGEVIVDWLLSSFLKDRSQSTTTSPIFNPRYWGLLLDVLSDKSNARPLKTWLTPVLYRTPLQPILSVFLAKLNEVGSPSESVETVSSCVSIIWPISAQKISLEHLADLFNLLLQKADEGTLTPGIISIGNLVTSSYCASLGNSVNKKKFYLLFLQSFLPRWLRVLVKFSTSSSDLPLDPQIRFAQNIYESATDTLFNLDILRQLSESRSTDQATALFEHLSKARSSQSDSQCLLHVLPRLFLSYVQGVKRYRGAVFSQSSSISGAAALNDEANAASMRFFANCEAIVAGDNGSGGDGVEEVQVWDARLKLLETVFDEKLFSVQQEDATMMLGKIVEDAVGVLVHSWNDVHADVISSAVKCLHKIGQIDCDLLLPSLPRILPPLLPISSTDPAPASLLDLILDYHSKTRTLNAHIHNLLISFAPTSLPSSETTDIHQVYDLCFSGHFLSSKHLEKLGNAIRRFLTPGQTSKTVDEVLETLRNTWQVFFGVTEGKDDEQDSPKKRRKSGAQEDANAMAVDSSSDSQTRDAETLAVSFSLQAYLILLILSNLPMQSLTETSTANVRESVSEFWEQTVRKALEKLLKLKRLSPGSGKKKRRKESMAGRDGWAMQIVGSAMLRVNYGLSVARGLYLERQLNTDKVIEQAKEVVSKDEARGNLIPELELEIFRTLLYYTSLDNVSQDGALQVFDAIMSYLERAFKPSDCHWSGMSCQLKTTESGALAVLHLLLERWLPFIDHLASSIQLASLVKMVLSINIDTFPAAHEPNLRPEHLLLRLLHSAEFWEMQNLRTAFLAHLVEITNLFESRIQDSELAAYHLLLYVPVEYFTKAAHKGKSKQSIEREKVVLQQLITLRVFLRRVIKLVGFERVSVSSHSFQRRSDVKRRFWRKDVDLGDYVVHLMSFDYQVEGPEHAAFVQCTLDLTGICFSELLKNVDQHSSALLKVIASFNQYPLFIDSSEGPVHGLQSQIIANLVNQMIKLKDTTSLPCDCIDSLRGFHQRLGKTILQKIQTIVPAQLARKSEVLVGWCCVLELRRWLHESQTGDDNSLGRRLVSIAVQTSLRDEKLDSIRVSIFAILRAELALLSKTEARQRQLDLIIATFIVFYNASGDAACNEFDGLVSATIKSLSLDGYSHALILLSESLSSGSLATEKLETVVHFAILLLRSHPQHTLKHMQTFATQCLNALSGNKIFTRGNNSLRMLTLEFVLQHCSERPATLRSLDIGSICMILFRLLEPSEEHDVTTIPEIFHKIVASLSALVRLRRDLVTPVLPHLCQLLRRLLSSIRSCLPQLGSKQTAMVMRTQPQWIASKQPLGSEEGRMLSRLLETLNVKTIIRSHTASETQKAESLAKPFSKHAAYVLAAYLEALNDPLCVLGVEMRRELEPGLFTLCEIMGEHARDALVVGLDASGKAALKLIWKDYEKQRYVGKG